MNNEKATVKFGEWIEAGFNLYKENFVVLVVANLIAVMLSAVSLGILAGPMMAGIIMIALRLLDKKEPKAEIGDVFNGFQCFLDSFLFVVILAAVSIAASLLLNLIPCAGPILSFAFSICLSTLILFGLFLIADRRMSFWPAALASINLVKTNFFPFAGLMIVVNILGYIGAVACGIGVIITMPLATCITAVAYRELFGKP